jgi:hypothetical protein
VYDCRAAGSGQYGYCEFPLPAPGSWYALVQRRAGAGRYQLVTTIVGGAPPACGNDRTESGEECDGADDLACPGSCDPSCVCAAFCAERAFVSVHGELGPRFLVKAVLDDRAEDMVDPRGADFALSFVDGGPPVEILIPADDPRWTRPAGQPGVYQWSGRSGLHRVVLRYRQLAPGRWLVTLKGSPGRALPAD